MRLILSRRRTTVLCGALVALLLTSGRANAAPLFIGEFSYSVFDNFFGPVFSVTNSSDRAINELGDPVDVRGAFTNVSVLLYSGTNATPVFTLPLTFLDDPSIAPSDLQNGFRQTTDLIPVSFDSASLVLDFSRPGAIEIGRLAGLSFAIDPDTGDFVPADAISQGIYFTVPDPTADPVPEPATLLLVASGLGSLALRRHRQRRAART